MKRSRFGATAMLMAVTGMAAMPAATQEISLQDCLNDASNRYDAKVRECDRRSNWLDRLSCRIDALNAYYVDRNLCFTAPRPWMPQPVPAAKPPSGNIA